MSWLISFLRTVHETRQVFGCLVGMCFVLGLCCGVLICFLFVGFLLTFVVISSAIPLCFYLQVGECLVEVLTEGD